MTQSSNAQNPRKQVALRSRADARSLAQRRADFAAQMRDMAVSDLANVSRRLKELHEELEALEGRRWTQQQIADKLGIPYRTFQSWEAGEVENSDGEGYDKIARFYSRKFGRKITRQWILFGDDGPPAMEPRRKPKGTPDPFDSEREHLERLEKKIDKVSSALDRLVEQLPEPEKEAQA